MSRFLFLVSCSNPAPLDLIRRRLAGKEHVEVTLDRRYRERRRHDVPPAVERRSADRRQHAVDTTLADLGWALVDRQSA